MRRALLLLLPLSLAACVGDSTLSPPMDDIGNRPTPLHFGMHVSPDPAENPIDPPERFEGYHAAVDYEVSAEELDADVPVYAVCSGKVVYSGFAEGYGGLLVHRCRIDGQDVTVLYGHLAVDSLPKTGSTLKAGAEVAILGAARSRDSDGNRKHLHLGIHKGRDIVTLGYVQTERALEDYLDPADVIPHLSIEDVLPDLVPYWKSASGAAVSS